MFDVQQHRYNYFYNMATVVENLIPEDICDTLVSRINELISEGAVDHVKHSGIR